MNVNSKSIMDEELDKLVELSMLYDFYGELLKEHQKVIYEDYILNDLSLGEIAKEQGISRQGVYDLVKRCSKQLIGYEEKLHLVEKFERSKTWVNEIKELAEQVREVYEPIKIEQIEHRANCILNEL